jgi:hypothetical protein
LSAFAVPAIQDHYDIGVVGESILEIAEEGRIPPRDDV